MELSQTDIIEQSTWMAAMDTRTNDTVCGIFAMLWSV